MKDLLEGKKIEDFEKALFSDGGGDWSNPLYYVGSVGDGHFSCSNLKHLIRVLNKESIPGFWMTMKPLPKETPLTDNELKSSLVGIVVEVEDRGHIRGYHRSGSLGFDFDNGGSKFMVSGAWFKAKHLKKFMHPTSREMLDITRENLIEASLLKEGSE